LLATNWGRVGIDEAGQVRKSWYITFRTAYSGLAINFKFEIVCNQSMQFHNGLLTLGRSSLVLRVLVWRYIFVACMGCFFTRCNPAGVHRIRPPFYDRRPTGSYSLLRSASFNLYRCVHRGSLGAHLDFTRRPVWHGHMCDLYRTCVQPTRSRTLSPGNHSHPVGFPSHDNYRGYWNLLQEQVLRRSLLICLPPDPTFRYVFVPSALFINSTKNSKNVRTETKTLNYFRDAVLHFCSPAYYNSSQSERTNQDNRTLPTLRAWGTVRSAKLGGSLALRRTLSKYIA
jgi:hypothetical protein